jgi:hypothetical protein
MLGDEHVAAAVVVEDPADVALQEMVQSEVPLVREAPDPLAGVVQVSGAALADASVRVDVLSRRGR